MTTGFDGLVAGAVVGRDWGQHVERPSEPRRPVGVAVRIGVGGDADQRLGELIRVGRLAVAAPDAELEALEALADQLYVRWEGADPALGAAFAEEILALRRRLAVAAPSEASLEALQHALAGAAMAASDAGQIEREQALVAELRGS